MPKFWTFYICVSSGQISDPAAWLPETDARVNTGPLCLIHCPGHHCSAQSCEQQDRFRASEVRDVSLCSVSP